MQGDRYATILDGKVAIYLVALMLLGEAKMKGFGGWGRGWRNPWCGWILAMWKVTVAEFLCDGLGNSWGGMVVMIWGSIRGWLVGVGRGDGCGCIAGRDRGAGSGAIAHFGSSGGSGWMIGQRGAW